MKASAVACANQGLIKYWGKTDEVERLPTNDSISVCLDALTTRTTVEFSARYPQDSFVLNGHKLDDQRIFRHLDLIRSLARSTLRARVESQNDFPPAVGLASSASGFAALTVAACGAIGLSLPQDYLTRIARKGSASASRSIPGGFAQLVAGGDDVHTIASSLAGPDDIDFKTLVVVVGKAPKPVSSTEGMRITAHTSPFFRTRLSNTAAVLETMRNAIAQRDSLTIMRLAEADTLSMHACMLTSNPPLVYWTGGTLEVVRTVLSLRKEGRTAYFSIDAGQNVFVNTSSEEASLVKTRLEETPGVVSVLSSSPGGPARFVDDNLF